MFSKKTINVILITFAIIAAIVENRIRDINNYDITGFRFVCNKEVCEIRHLKQNKEIKYVDKIDISKIEKFSYKLEKVPRTTSKGMVIYADCKDGTSFRLSPMYVKPSRYLEIELIKPLNAMIKADDISFDIKFP